MNTTNFILFLYIIYLIFSDIPIVLIKIKLELWYSIGQIKKGRPISYTWLEYSHLSIVSLPFQIHNSKFY